MSKMSKAIAVLGVVAGLGVAALPLSSYAADSALPSASKSGQVQVEVEGAIAIDFVEPTTSTNTAPITFDHTAGLLDLQTIKINGTPAEGTMGVRVATNNATGYTLSIKASSTDMVGSGSAEGFSIPTNANVDQGIAGWAFKVVGATGEQAQYANKTAVSTDAQTIKKTTTVSTGEVVGDKKTDVTEVTFIVAADDKTHEGTYVGTVVYTATVND